MKAFSRFMQKHIWRLCCVHKPQNINHSFRVMSVSFSKLYCKTLFLLYFIFL